MPKVNSFAGKVCLVIDNGIFVHFAQKMAESFGKVYYWTPYVNAFPKSNATLIGDGIDGITRVLDWEDHVDEADIITFPDVMFGSLQEHLIRQGKRVFGARKAEYMELNRWSFKQLLRSLNMPVAETHLIRGMEPLCRFLQTHENYWIKTSRYRGDFETFQSENYDDVKPRLDLLEAELGMKGAVYPFIVEKHIDAVIELGFDGYCVDGQFPKQCAFGKEEKDLGYVGVFVDYDALPEPLKWVNAKLSAEMKHHQYRGLYSSEVRCARETTEQTPEEFEDFPMIWNAGEQIGDWYAFLTDPCCRMASPPGELYIEWFSNWPEIVWSAAEGTLIDPEPVAKYGVEIMLHSAWADSHWQPVRFPEEIKQWVKLRNCCQIEGVYSAVPQSVGLPEIGAVVALHDDLAETCRLALKRSAQVTGYFIEPRNEAIQKAITDIHNAQEEGIHFTDDPLPDAETLESLQPTE